MVAVFYVLEMLIKRCLIMQFLIWIMRLLTDRLVWRVLFVLSVFSWVSALWRFYRLRSSSNLLSLPHRFGFHHFWELFKYFLASRYRAPARCDRTAHAVYLRPNSTFTRSRSQGCVSLCLHEMQIHSNKYVLIPLMRSVARFNEKRVNLPPELFYRRKKKL